MYDAATWFIGVAGNLMQGKNMKTGVGLATSIPPRRSRPRPASGCSNAS